MLWRLRQKVGVWIKGVRTGERLLQPGEKDLSGDRQLEWSYVISRTAIHASKGDRVLDFGCDSGMLSIAASTMGCEVKGIDLLPQKFATKDVKLSFEKTDVIELPESELFNVIVHSSVIEHVGLWGRYGEQRGDEKDFEAMQKMGRLLKPGGVMVMTLPVGMDTLVHPSLAATHHPRRFNTTHTIIPLWCSLQLPAHSHAIICSPQLSVQ